MLCALHIILGIASIFTWKPCCEKPIVFSHKLMPPPVLKKCYLHVKMLCILYQTIKACLQNEHSALLHIFRHFSNMLQVHSVFLVPGKQNCFYLCKKHTKYLLWLSWIKECLRDRLQEYSEPQSLPPERVVSDIDCKCCSWKWEFFGHWHCGSESLRGPILMDSLVYSFALQGDVIVKHCL